MTAPRAPDEGDLAASDNLRFVEKIFLENEHLQLMRTMADELGITPRDLEIMVFFAYSDFNISHGIDITKNENAQYIIQDVSMHLASGDGRDILLSSYCIYSLRHRELDDGRKGELLEQLWDAVHRMHPPAPYTSRFYNEAYRLRTEIMGGAES